MLAECAQDLLTKVQSIPALANSCGMAIGGTIPDPGMTKITLPAAWILFKRAKNTHDAQSALPSLNTNALLTYVVVVYLPTSSQIGTQLPLLQSVIKTIQGTTAPSGSRWYWDATDLAAFNPDRMIYPLFFSANAMF